MTTRHEPAIEELRKLVRRHRAKFGPAVTDALILEWRLDGRTAAEIVRKLEARLEAR